MSLPSDIPLAGPRPTWRDLVHDPSWSDLLGIRWSEEGTGQENVADVARETLSHVDADEATRAHILALADLIASRAHASVLRRHGLVDVRMADVVLGMTGRVGWAFVADKYLVLIVMHSASEDDIPGEHLDDGKNAYTEVVLQAIRSRSGGTAHFAFATRMGRTQRNRQALTLAMKRYRWTCRVAGQAQELENGLLEALGDVQAETKTRDFHEASGKGELDDLTSGLYPRSEFGLPFTHRFRREVVTEHGRSFTKVYKKEVVPDPTAAPALQALARMVAAGEPWEVIGRKAGELGVRARAGVDDRHQTGRTLADLLGPGHSIRRQFNRHLELFRTGKRQVRWHGKVQGGAVYGGHGRPEPYSLEQLRAMTPRQRRKADKGFFEVELEWGCPVLPDGEGNPSPWGVPAGTWALIEKRLARENAVGRPVGAAAQLRDVKPLVGVHQVHEWHDEDMAYAILGQRRAQYELHTRPRGVRVGWRADTGQTLAVWRSSDYHQSVGRALEDLLVGLADEVCPIDIVTTSTGARAETRRAGLQREALASHRQAETLRKQARGVDELARVLAADGRMDEALAQLAAKPALVQQAQAAEAHAHSLELRAHSLQEQEETRQPADFAEPVTVAAGLLAYADQAPWPLAHACAALLHDHRAEVVNDGFTVRWQATLHLRLTSGDLVAQVLSGEVPNRLRPARRPGATQQPQDLLERTARRWFTAPTAVSFEQLAQDLGWQPSEVRRKVGAWLGSRLAVPKGVALVERVPHPGLRAAVLDCPLVELRHALWAALMPAEAAVASYLPEGYRKHIADTYLTPGLVWCFAWAADTHAFRRRLMDLCLNQPEVERGVRFDHAARELAVGEQDIADFSRPFKVNQRRNRAPAYPPSFERVHPFGRDARHMPPDDRRVRPRRCPHPDCEGKRAGRDGGWCTVVLRVPELFATALLCPDCRRAPDAAMSDVRFPASYLTRWAGPCGFQSGRGGERAVRGTVAEVPPGGTVES
jgi:hypothetical protein